MSAYVGPIAFGAAMRPYQQSFWGQTLPDHATLDTNSAATVASLAAQAQAPNALPTINTDPRWTAEPYVLPASSGRTPITLTRTLTTAISEIAQAGVPFPDRWTPSGGDSLYTVWLPDWVDPGDSTITGQYLELIGVSVDPSTGDVSASNIARADGVNVDVHGHYGNWTASGYDPQNPADPDSTYEVAGEGVAGSGLPVMPGVISAEDFRRGYVDHAIHLAVAHAAPGHVWPAQKDDGDDSTTLVMEGQRFRLAAGYTTGGVHWICEMLIRAASQYGIVITDKTAYKGSAGNLAFRAAPSAASFFGGMSGSQVLVGFPWAHLQLLEVGSDSNPTPAS